jgi:arsenate reductase
MITIYHNPRCSKSRECLQLLELQEKPFTVVKYLDNTLTQKELVNIITILGIKPIELVRQKEAVWIENYRGKNLPDNDIIDAMLKHPQLIERPIVINNNKGVIARPAGRINEIL